MAEVFTAVDRMKASPVVIKIFRKPRKSTLTYQRFKREVRILQSISHINILKILDFGFLRNERPYFTMPALDGVILERHLAYDKFSYTSAINIAVQLLKGLRAAHQNNIVHRDLKPRNVFLTTLSKSRKQLVKILDFGMSKILDWELPSITETGVGIGMDRYMAPEQVVDAKSATQSADVYSMGLILYELFSGTSPFYEFDKTNGIFDPVTSVPFKSPVTYNPQLPSNVGEVILKSINLSPTNRYANASQMLQALSLAVQSPDEIDLASLNCEGTKNQLPISQRSRLKEMFRIKPN